MHMYAVSILITYILSIISYLEAKKTVLKHVPIGRQLELQSDEPWDTLLAQIVIQIDSVLHSSRIQFSDYNISFTISHTVTQPLPLNSVANYSFLVSTSNKKQVCFDYEDHLWANGRWGMGSLMALCEYTLTDTQMPTEDGKNKENKDNRNDQNDDESRPSASDLNIFVLELATLIQQP